VWPCRSMCTRKDVQRAALAFGKEHEHGCETMDVIESQVSYPQHAPGPVRTCSSGMCKLQLQLKIDGPVLAGDMELVQYALR